MDGVLDETAMPVPPPAVRECEAGQTKWAGETTWKQFNKSKGRWYVHWRNSEGKHVSQLLSRWIWEREYGPIPPGSEIHHKD